MTGVVQIGKCEFVLLESEPGVVRYRVEAPVLDYFGDRAKPGAVWTLQDGRCSSGETAEQVLERVRLLYGASSFGIVRFDGPESDWPYLSGREEAVVARIPL